MMSKFSTRLQRLRCAMLVMGCALATLPLAVHAQEPPAKSIADAAPAEVIPRYELHPTETEARFEAKFLRVITVRGKFNRTTGTLLHDPVRTDATSRANDSIVAEIDATSLETLMENAEATNDTLRGPSFFNVEKFPTVTFRSARFNWEGEGHAGKLRTIDGSLTLLGVTRPVTLTVEKSGCTPASAMTRARCTADAFVNVKRKDFGMKAWSSSVSNQVKIAVALVAYAVEPALNPSAARKTGEAGDSKSNEGKSESKADAMTEPKSEAKPDPKR
jgi:polyisoprenoid-binding protein YceI